MPSIKIRLFTDKILPFPVRPAILVFTNHHILQMWKFTNKIDWDEVPSMEAEINKEFPVSYFIPRKMEKGQMLEYAVREFTSPKYHKKFHESFPEYNGLYVGWALSENFYDRVT